MILTFNTKNIFNKFIAFCNNFIYYTFLKSSVELVSAGIAKLETFTELKELTDNPKIEVPIKNIQPQEQIKSESKKPPKIELPNEEEIDDIPPELKAVFDEDENGITPTEITQGETQKNDSENTNSSEDFQTLVDNESENQ